MNVTDQFEKLGAFYLGREYDLQTRQRGETPVLYDSRDLVTHAVCVGMTGSGKTGLCIDILEEAAIDGIPAIVIDPKGDLTNLLLTFPELRPEDFAPWINEDDARRVAVTPAQFAEQQAALWTRGLAEWGQSGTRIQKLVDAAQFSIYTPGSGAGLPVSLLRSFAAPSRALVEEPELFRERISGTVAGLLGLIGVPADPQNREHILLSTILAQSWAAGHDVDLPNLIQQIQQPPVRRVGVMDLDTFYPPKERFELALQLNSLLAAPGFARWTEGEPLDIGALLHTPEGHPRVSIFSIAHLSDAERMFFVALLLNETLAWVRAQSGTTSLRAILYMDEIAGYCPPVANPPSKPPLLMLMKQARAFGLGLVLATQNPVDLDYKGLSNAGTWFIGRLQTERDKARVLDGLEGAAAGAAAKFDRATVDRMLSQLGNRVFVMNNVHEEGPRVFETRWALSYLRGPLTREQIKLLMEPAKRKAASVQGAPDSDSVVAPQAISAATAGGEANVTSTPPALPPDIPQYFIPARQTGRILYKPMLFGCANVHFRDSKAGVEHDTAACYLAPLGSGPGGVDWNAAEPSDFSDTDLKTRPDSGGTFAALPPEATRAAFFKSCTRSFADMVFRTASLKLLRSPQFKQVSKVGESERDFRLRLQQSAREQRDEQVEKLRNKYAPKVAALRDRISRAEQAVQVQKSQASAAKLQTAVSAGAALLGALTGRKVASAGNVGRVATAARGAGRAAREAGDVERAEQRVAVLERQLHELQAQFEREVEELAARLNPQTERLEEVTVRPRKADVRVRAVVLAWAPLPQ